MKAIAITLLLYAFTSNIVNAQALPNDVFENQIYFKIKDVSTVVFNEYDIKTPINMGQIDHLLSKYNIICVRRPYEIFNTPFFNRVYWILMDSGSNSKCDSLLADLSLINCIEFSSKIAKVIPASIPNDPMLPEMWMADAIDLLKAHDISDGDGVTIGIIDDAFDIEHEDLINQCAINSGEINGNGLDDDGNGYIDDYYGWNIADDSGNVKMPPNYINYKASSHGTMVTGISSAERDNGKGGFGSGFKAKFVPIKCKSDRDINFVGVAYSIPTFFGFSYAFARHVDVINMSWGHIGTYSIIEDSVIQFLIGQNIILVAAVGNSGNLFDDTLNIYPASYDNVIAVGASIRNFEKAAYSNGPSHTRVDVFAPGSNIVSCKTDVNDIYFGGHGTSAASPVVAGVCALVRKSHPTYTVSQIRDCIINGAIDISNSNRDQLNFGEFKALDAENAINCVSNKKVIPFIVDEDKYYFCLDDTINVSVRGGTNLSYSFFDNISNKWSSRNADTSFHIINPDMIAGPVGIKVRVYDNLTNYVIYEKIMNSIAVYDSCNIEKLSQSNWIFGNGATINFNDSGIHVDTSRGHSLIGYSNTISDFAGNELFTIGLKRTAFGRSEFNATNPIGGVVFPNFVKQMDPDLGSSFGSEDFTSKTSLCVIPDYFSDSIYFAILGNQANDAYNNSETYREMEFVRFNPQSNQSYRFVVTAPTGYKLGIDSSMKTGSGYKLIQHQNGKDFWLICTADQYEIPGNAGKIFVFLVERMSTWPGLNITLSSFYNNDNFNDYRAVGGYTPTSIVSNHKGDKIAFYQFQRVDISGSYPVRDDEDSLVQLLNFNQTTGILSSPAYLRGFVYSPALAFSPNDELIYGFKVYNGLNASLFQWDLDSNDLVGKPVFDANALNGIADGMEYGPDGKLYINYNEQSALGVITMPNERVVKDNDNAPGYFRRGVNVQVSSINGGRNNDINTNFGLPVYVCDPDEIGLDFAIEAIDCDSIKLISTVKSQVPVNWSVDGNPFLGNTITVYAPTLKEYDILMIVRGKSINKKYDRRSEIYLSVEYFSCDSVHAFIDDSTFCNAQNSWYLNGNLIATDVFGVNYPLAGYSFPTNLEVHIRGGILSKTINPQPQAPVINHGITKIFLDANGVSKLYNTNTKFGSYPSFLWYYNNQPQNLLPITDTLYAIKPGKYMIYTSTSCGDITSQIVEVCFDCNNPNFDTTYATQDHIFATGTSTNLSSGVTWLLSGLVTVDSAATLNIYGDVVFTPCSQLLIKPGGHLNIENSFISSCGIWKGILVEGSPTIDGPRFFNQDYHGTALIRYSKISNAIVALRTENGGFAMMDEDTFINNYANVWFRNYDFVDNSGVSNSLFGNNKGQSEAAIDTMGCLDSTIEYKWYYHSAPSILTERVRNNIFSNNKIEDDKFLYPGPPKDHIAYVVGEYCKGQRYSNNTFISTHNDWVFHLNYADSITISGNEMSFNSNYYGGGTPLRAIYMKQCTGGKIEQNIINNAFTGIEYYYDSTSYSDSLKVYENEFTDVNIGIFAATTEFAVNNDVNTNTYTNVIPIKTECNEFDGSEIGIAGCGQWLPQGGRWITGIPRSAGNRFISTTTANAVLDHTSNVKYRWSHLENIDGEKDPKPSLKTSSTQINGNTISDVSSGFNSFISIRPDPAYVYYFNPNCASAIPIETNSTSDISLIFKVYPNPSNGEFTIKSPNDVNYSYEVYNLSGKLIIGKGSEKKNIFGNELSNGVYILKIMSRNKIHVTKIIKI